MEKRKANHSCFSLFTILSTIYAVLDMRGPSEVGNHTLMVAPETLPEEMLISPGTGVE